MYHDFRGNDVEDYAREIVRLLGRLHGEEMGSEFARRVEEMTAEVKRKVMAELRAGLQVVFDLQCCRMQKG